MSVVFVYEMTDVIWIAVIVSCSPIMGGGVSALSGRSPREGRHINIRENGEKVLRANY